MADEHYLTAEGFAELKEELEQLRGPERIALAKRLRDAIQMGDLSENADYHKAKEDQGFLEGRIQELEYILGRAVIIDTTNKPRDSVQVGATVTIQEDGSEEETYTIVGAAEANPRDGKISNESPIGKAILNHRAGEEVQVEAPDGSYSVRIVKIG